LLGVVAADALEYGGAVTDDVRKDMKLASSQLMNFPLCQIFSVF